MIGKGMKLSSFTKYLHLRVINTEVSRMVAAAAAVLLLSAFPAKAQEGRPATPDPQTGIRRPANDTARDGKVRGDVDGIPAGHFRILGEAARKQHEADSAALIALQTANNALEAGPDRKEALLQKAALDSTKMAAREAEADTLLLTLQKIADGVSAVPYQVTGEATPAHQLSCFRMMPGQAYSQDNPVPFEPAMPEGLIYTIQVAAFRNDVAPALFRGLTPVFGMKRPGSEAIYYFAGMFRRFDDAKRALPEARGAGFPDAFIIALMGGMQVSLERAAPLEKEWGSRPLDVETAVSTAVRPAGEPRPATATRQTTNTTQPAAATRQNSNATQPPAQVQPVPIGTLSLRAEVMRINKPVKPEAIQKIELLAGNRGLDMIKISNGETVFLVGNFITFESADDYVSLLVRNGYSSARVAAYVGTQEIPVEAARELLNKMPDD